MHDKDIEKHAVAGSEKERREYLKVFEGELWIRHDDHRRETDEARRLGEARYREANKAQRKQLLDMLTWRNKLTAVLCWEGFQNLTQRGGTTPSMMKWAVEMVIDKESRLVTNETFQGVVEHAYKVLKENGVIDE
jgi:hypothetical protein